MVNLACKAILSAISKLDYATISFNSASADDGDGTFMDNIKQDPVAAIRVLIRAVGVARLLFFLDIDVFTRFEHRRFADNTLPSSPSLFIRKIFNFFEIWMFDGHQRY